MHMCGGLHSVPREKNTGRGRWRYRTAEYFMYMMASDVSRLAFRSNADYCCS